MAKAKLEKVNVNNIKVVCDECNHEFTVKKKSKNITVEIKEEYFSCPKCKHHYSIQVTNAEIRKEQREIQKLLKSRFIRKKGETLEEWDKRAKQAYREARNMQYYLKIKMENLKIKLEIE
jgi:transposase-like protein